MNQDIIVRDVTKRYAEHLALDKISLNVPRQSIYGLLGPNGAGKTTLIRILNQITVQDSGEILLFGNKLNPSHISKIGYLPEERGLYKKMKVGEQAIYLAQLKGLSKPEAEKRLKEWFEKFEILAWWNKKVEELSKGMQQKIQFITTIIHKPEVLILDEPFSGFDPINANLLKETIFKLRDEGATVFLSTHNMASVEELCDKITLINHGKKILEGQVNEIKQQYKSYTFEIILQKERSEKTNLLPERFVIKEEENIGNSQMKLIVKANQNDNQNELIKSLLNEGKIISFREILPSMNEIFIQQVQSQND
jgi:ABC-type uncharacterized transport system, ATPase component